MHDLQPHHGVPLEVLAKTPERSVQTTVTDALTIIAIWALWVGKLGAHRTKGWLWYGLCIASVVSLCHLSLSHPWASLVGSFNTLLIAADFACLTIWSDTWVRKPLWVRKHRYKQTSDGEWKTPFVKTRADNVLVMGEGIREPIPWTDPHHFISALSTYPITLYALWARWPLCSTEWLYSLFS